MKKCEYIIDIHGNRTKKSLCRKYKEGYYIKNKDCANVNGKWYRLEKNPAISFDHEHNQWINRNSTKAIHGIIGKDDKNNFIYGYFSSNLNKNVSIFSLDTQFKLNTVLDYNIIKTSYTEKLDNGIYYPNILLTKMSGIFNTKRIGSSYTRALDYKCNYLLDEVTEKFNKFFTPTQLPLDNTKNSNIYNLLDDTTYGIEYETFDGMIPENICYANGLIPVKDGSLRRKDDIYDRDYTALEYSTIILRGKIGIQAIKKHCELLNKYCEYSYKEALHIHLGNIPASKEFVVSIYRVSLLLQKEIYSMFPEAMQKTSFFKNKDYCKPLPTLAFTGELENDFLEIYYFLLDGHERTFTGFNRFHPNDVNNNQKWNIEKRYSIVNFITLVFNPQQTVEWRIHPITHDANSIVYWLYVINAINQYANKYKEALLTDTLTLQIVISNVYSGYNVLIEALLCYINACKQDMLYKKETFNDIVGMTSKTICWKDQLNNEYLKLV